jgi:O-antigen/teichoic acid export membrane protein
MPFLGTASHNAHEGIVLNLYFLVYILQGFFLAVAFGIKNKSWRQISFPSLQQSGQVLKYSLIAHSGNIIFFLGYRIDYWFVHINRAVCTDADLGNYIQVSKMGQLFLIVPQIIASVIFPRSASGGNRVELSTALMTISRLLSQFFLLTFVITLLFGGVLFSAVFGPTFNQMQWPFLIIVPGIFCLSVLVLLAAYFSGKGVLRVNVVGNAIALAVIVAGDYFLVPVYGIIGAALVSTVGYFVNTLYSLMRFYKEYSITWADFFKWRRQDYTWLFNLITGGA